MDPNANWAEQVRYAESIIAAADNDRDISEDDAECLAALVLAMRDWLVTKAFKGNPNV